MYDTRDVLFVGGPYHGTVRRVQRPTVAFIDPALHGQQVTAPVRRCFWIFPGRTDFQLFEACVYPGGGWPDCVDAALKAWAGGWSPPDSASEYSRG